MIRALPPVFRTARLLAQRLEARHLGDLERLYAEPAVTDWLGGGRTRGEVEEWLEGRVAAHWDERGYGLYALYEKHAAEAAPAGTPRFVGRAGLQLAAADVRGALGEPEAVELLYALMPDHWGRGYATEIGRILTGLALGSLDLQSVIAYTLPANERSRRVLATLGFAEEGEVLHERLPHVLYRRRRG
jgi:RimJ/RimL family protein N-acetyltransferase